MFRGILAIALLSALPLQAISEEQVTEAETTEAETTEVVLKEWQNKTAQDIINSDMTAEEKGLAISVELDERDLGYGDQEVLVEMELENSHGQKSTRKMRNQTFELQDTSVGDKTMIIFDEPRDVKGTAFLTFSQILEPDDQWLYLPSLKRVKRISSKNKSGPFVGSEFAYEDISSQEVGKYTYKYLSSEPCPTAEFKDLQCFVIDRYPAYEHSGYTKQIAWVDHQEFRPVKMDFYDRKDSLLKTLTYESYKQYLDRYWRADRFRMVNHLNGKNTVLHWKEYKFRVGLSEDDFTKAKLKNAK